jgi:hypothetical protein
VVVDTARFDRFQRCTVAETHISHVHDTPIAHWTICSTPPLKHPHLFDGPPVLVSKSHEGDKLDETQYLGARLKVGTSSKDSVRTVPATAVPGSR